MLSLENIPSLHFTHLLLVSKIAKMDNDDGGGSDDDDDDCREAICRSQPKRVILKK